jgi:hypothetical protein
MINWLPALAVLAAAGIGLSFHIGGATRDDGIGVILLHGKLGDPLERRAGLDMLAANLRAAGCAIALPTMPWSDKGWLTITATCPPRLR